MFASGRIGAGCRWPGPWRLVLRINSAGPGLGQEGLRCRSGKGRVCPARPSQFGGDWSADLSRFDRGGLRIGSSQDLCGLPFGPGAALAAEGRRVGPSLRYGSEQGARPWFAAGMDKGTGALLRVGRAIAA